MRMICTTIAALLVCFISIAQTEKVRGRILDESGNPVPFARISVKGSKDRTSAGADGKFTISIIKFPAELEITVAGYTALTYLLKEENIKNEIKIILHPFLRSLEEVVVVTGMSRGYSDDRAPFAASVSDKTSARKSTHAGATAELKGRKDSYSRILTAGELSDFKKWKLWGDYSASEFSSLSDQWQLELQKRYCVQVQNENHRGMAGEKIYLLNRDTRDTVWSAITDNTGKAELWGDFNNELNEQANYLLICRNKVLNNPYLFGQGINRFSFNISCDMPNAVDIAFVVDATGSMGDEIRYLQSELGDIISATAAKYKETNLRLGAVFYRDHGDEYLTRELDFQNDPSILVDFIRRQSAGGGGDFPEAVEDALEVALTKLHWSNHARTKILFLVLDAPPHDAAKEKMKTLIRQAAANGIRIVPIVCSGINKSTEYLMRCASLATNGSYIFLTDDSGVGNPHIKPTTDEFKVELLNELLVRLIGEMIYVTACNETLTKPVKEKDSTELIVKVKIYPNPTSGRVIIESEKSLQQIYLADFTGKLLRRMDTRDKKRRWSIDLGIYPSGTYLVKYFNQDKGWGTEKLVLIH